MRSSLRLFAPDQWVWVWWADADDDGGIGQEHEGRILAACFLAAMADADGGNHAG